MRQIMAKMEKTPIDVSSILRNGRNIHYIRCMEHRTQVYDLIALWPCRADLAADLSSILGNRVPVDRIHKWAKNGAVPAGMQAHFLRAVQARGFDLTAIELLDIHASPVSQTPEDAA